MIKSAVIIYILVFSIFSTASSQAPGDTLWTRTYGASNSEQGNCVQQTSDGGYIMVGLTATYGPPAGNVWMIKTDSGGSTEWTQVYGGNGEDIAFYVEQTDDGGYIVTGHTSSFGAGNSDIWLLKTDAYGDTLWARTYGGSDWEKSFSVEQTTDGGYIVIGRTKTFGAGGYDFYLVKTDSSGNELWTQTYGGSSDERGYFVRQTPDDGYILTGETRSFGSGGSDMYLVKTDASGNTLWTNTYGGTSSDDASCVQLTTDGGYIVGGKTFSYGAGSADFYLVKTDSSGNELWSQTYGGVNSELCEELRQTADGGYILAGRTESFGAVEKDVYLVKTDAAGDTLWTHMYGGVNYEYCNSVQQTADGNYITLGYTGSYGAGLSDFFLIRIAGESGTPIVSIELTPNDPPVIVPRGGSFSYNGTLTNNTNEFLRGDVWIMVDVPGVGIIGPIRQFNNIPLSAFQVIAANNINEDVPLQAPLGFYDIIGYCGDYPGTIIDSSTFEIQVVE
jgi:hypothetical protein